MYDIWEAWVQSSTYSPYYKDSGIVFKESRDFPSAVLGSHESSYIL